MDGLDTWALICIKPLVGIYRGIESFQGFLGGCWATMHTMSHLAGLSRVGKSIMNKRGLMSSSACPWHLAQGHGPNRRTYLPCLQEGL